MTTILLLAVCATVGASIPRKWTLLLPVSAGVLGAALMLLTGNRVSDTPIPFLIMIATLAIAAGMHLRKVVRPHMP
jgi:hypothetical protein